MDEPCFKAMKDVIRAHEKEDLRFVGTDMADKTKIVTAEEFKKKNESRFKFYDEIKEAVAKNLNLSKEEASMKCDFKSIDYADLVTNARGSFRVDDVPKVAKQIFSSFAEKSILAGHDLILMEGSPELTKATHADLLKKACSPEGAQLKNRIENSWDRIQRFKEKSKP